MPALPKLSTCFAVACLAAIATAARGADQEIVVHATSGRQFRGHLDDSSTHEQLVVRSVHGRITLLRPSRWQHIASATLDGKPTETGALRELVAREQGTGNRGQGTTFRRVDLQSLSLPVNNTAAPLPAELPPPRVALVAFDASIANWDADVETDGVVIDVAPLDIDRRLVPAGGTLEVELFAQERRTLDLAPNSGGETLELVERWTRAIAPDEFTANGVRLRLPFGAITPELQSTWRASPYGLVHVRLAVPGHGVFEDSRDMVRLRPYSPNRDRLEMKTGQRFLPTENLGRHD